jgi:hypothetical protein
MSGAITVHYESLGLYRRFEKDAKEEIHVAHEGHEEKIRIPSCTLEIKEKQNG